MKESDHIIALRHALTRIKDATGEALYEGADPISAVESIEDISTDALALYFNTHNSEPGDV